jgi:hypothetical protein
MSRAEDSPRNNSIAHANGEQFITGITHSLLKTYSRELTVVSSTLCVLALMIVGTCIWCISKLCRDKYKPARDFGEDNSDTSSLSTPTRYFEGWKLPPSKDPSAKKPSDANASNTKMEGKSHLWKKKFAYHKNIITPDRNIEFVVPTVSERLFKNVINDKTHSV